MAAWHVAQENLHLPGELGAAKLPRRRHLRDLNGIYSVRRERLLATCPKHARETSGY